MKRRYLTERLKAVVLVRFGGRCAIANCADPGPYEFDHAYALGIGGSNDLENFRPLCRAHHKDKTRADVKAIAKGKRQRKKFGDRPVFEYVEPQPLSETPGLWPRQMVSRKEMEDKFGKPKTKAKIQSRGFDKTRRRTMAGKVVPRVGKAKIA